MKRYTAKEMRAEAKDAEELFGTNAFSEMLKQAASDLDLLRRLVEADRAYDAACIHVDIEHAEPCDTRRAVLAEAEWVL